MTRKRHKFIEGLRRKQRDAAQSQAATPAEKPVAEMTEDELRAEQARLQREIRASDERAVQVGREALVGGQSGRFWFPRKPKRAPWK